MNSKTHCQRLATTAYRPLSCSAENHRVTKTIALKTETIYAAHPSGLFVASLRNRLTVVSLLNISLPFFENPSKSSASNPMGSNALRSPQVPHFAGELRGKREGQALPFAPPSRRGVPAWPDRCASNSPAPSLL